MQPVVDWEKELRMREQRIRRMNRTLGGATRARGSRRRRRARGNSVVVEENIDDTVEGMGSQVGVGEGDECECEWERLDEGASWQNNNMCVCPSMLAATPPRRPTRSALSVAARVPWSCGRLDHCEWV